MNENSETKGKKFFGPLFKKVKQINKLRAVKI